MNKNNIKQSIKISEFLFNKKFNNFKFSYNAKKQKKSFFKEELPHSYEIVPNSEVPANIPRPDYMLVDKFDYDNREYSTHKDEESINNQRKSCKITAKVLQEVENYNKITSFKTTEDIHKLVYDEIVNKHKAYPTAIGYMGFPKSVCTSVNESKNII